MGVRSNELSVARRQAVAKFGTRQGVKSGRLVARFRGMDEEDSRRALVAFDGGLPVSVATVPGQFVPESLVWVEVDEAGRPVLVTGPVTDTPVDATESAVPVEPVVSWAGTALDPVAARGMTPEERARLDETVSAVDQARADLAEAERVLAGEIEGVETRLTADGVITENMIATGAVSARTLNVVPADGQGGTVLTGTKIGMVNSDGTGMMDLSVDSDNYLSFYRDDAVNFSVSADGALTAQDVSANANLYYRGTELSEVLNARPYGVLTPFIGLAKNAHLSTVHTRLMGGSFTTPGMEDGGVREIEFLLQVQGRALADQLEFQLRATLDGSEPTMTSPLWANIQQTSDGTAFSLFRMSRRIRISPGQTVRFMWFVRSLKTSTYMILYPQDSVTYCQAADLGTSRGSPSFVTPEAPNIPPKETIAPRYYSTKWTSTSHKSYAYYGTGHRLAGQAAIQGASGYGDNSRSHWFFNDADIRAKTAGATITSGSLFITNQHSWASSGMYAVVKVHGYSSAPSTFGTAKNLRTVHVPKGKTVEVKLPDWVRNGLKNGTYRGFSLDAGGTTDRAYYGYFSPKATLSLNYNK